MMGADKEVTAKITLQGESGGMVSAMDRANAALFGTKKHADLLSEAGQELTGVLTGIGIVALAKQAVDAGLQMERLTKLFTAATGSASLGAREMEYASKMANRLGLDLLSTTESYGKFMASIKGTTLEGEKGRKVFEGVSTAVTALSLTADQSGRIFSQLQQMMSKGKVTAEDLNVVAESLPGVKQKMAEGLGITTAAMADMMEKGKLLAADVLPALATALDKAYGKAAAEGAKSAQAEVNRLNAAIFETKGVAGAALIPVFTDIVKALKPALGLLQEFIGGIQILAVKAASIPDRIGAAWNVVKSGKGIFSTEGMAMYAAQKAQITANEDAVIADIMKKFERTGSDYNAAELSRQAKINPAKAIDTKKPKDDTNTWASAHEEYLKYQEAFNAKRVAIAKAARDKELFDNEQGYANNLVSLSVYLAKKREAITDEFNEELIAASNNLDQRQKDLLEKAKTSAAKPNDAKAAQEYHAALKEVEKATTALTNVESKRNIGLLKTASDSEKAVYDEEIRLATLMEKQQEARRLDLDKTREFTTMRAALAGDTLTGELNNIERERQAWINGWAGKAASFEEHHQRMLEIETVFGQRRAVASIANEQRIAQTKLQVNQNYLNGFTALANAVNTIAGGKNKVLYAMTQAAAIATTFLSTEAAAAAALAPPPLGLGPVVGAPLAASIKISGYASMAAMAATTIANVAGIGSGSTPSTGQGGGTSTSPVVTQPITNTAAQQAPIIQIHLNGTVLSDPQAMTRWGEDYLAPMIRDLKTRGVTI